MTFFWSVISALGGTAALVAIAAFLAKTLVQHWLAKDIEDHKSRLSINTDKYKNELAKELELEKANLARANAQALDEAKFEFEKALIVRRGEVDLFRDQVKYLNESAQQRRARLYAQIQKWANPIGMAIGDLEHRLGNILSDGGYIALSSSSRLPENWSADYSYFMASTLYYFAQYFCWTRLLQRDLAFELFRSSDDMEAFRRNIEEVSDEIGRFPYRPDTVAGPQPVDGQVFRLQQRAIGELLFDKSGPTEQILTYREFLDRWLDPADTRFRAHIGPLEKFLADIRPQNDLRWHRLEGTRKYLIEFGNTCNRVLSPSGVEES
jgi:hypothetical protein